MKFVFKNIIKLLVLLLFILYSLQASFFGVGSPISMISVSVLMILQIFIFILSFKYFKSPVINSLYLIVFLSIFAFIYSSITEPHISGHQTSQVLVIMYITLFAIMIFYLTKKNVVKERDMIIFFSVYLMRSIFVFISAVNRMEINDVVGFTNNSGYAFVSILPFIFLFKKKYLQISLLFTMVLFIIASAKRGAIVIAILFSVFYFYSIRKQIKLNFINSILILIALFLFTWYIYDYYINNDYLQYRMEMTLEGSASGREIMYPKMWSYYISSNNILHLIFGFGVAASIKVIGLYAHNDWFELLLQNGLIGILVYLIFFIQIFKSSFKYKISVENQLLIKSILLIWFVETFFTMVITSVGSAPLAVILGYVIAKINMPIINEFNK